MQFPHSCNDEDPYIELGKKLEFVHLSWERGSLTRWELAHLLRLALARFDEIKDVK